MADPRYCRICGETLEERVIEGRSRDFCPSCAEPRYRNPKPCAGVLVRDGEHLLLIERTNPPAPGTWSVPAGYLEADEPPREAAVRELAEETGLETEPDALELFTTTFVSHPDGQHVLVLIYLVERAQTDGTVRPGTDASGARFWSLSELTASEAPIEPGYRDLFERALEGESESESESEVRR